MAIDVSDAQEQRPDGLIPDGTFVKLHAILRPGGSSIPNGEPMDAGLFKRAATSDAMMLDFEFKVVHGLWRGRGLYQMATVTGGSLDEKGQSKAWPITKSMIRAILESTLGIDPRDQSPAAVAKRSIPGFRSLNHLEFAAKIGVQGGDEAPDGGHYPDKNIISHIVLPGEAEYGPIMAGQDVAAKPTGVRRPRGGRSGGGAAAAPAAWSQRPAWESAGAAAQAAPAPSGAPSWVTQQPAAPAAAAPVATPAAGPSWLNNR